MHGTAPLAVVQTELGQKITERIVTGAAALFDLVAEFRDHAPRDSV